MQFAFVFLFLLIGRVVIVRVIVVNAIRVAFIQLASGFANGELVDCNGMPVAGLVVKMALPGTNLTGASPLNTLWSDCAEAIKEKPANAHIIMSLFILVLLISCKFSHLNNIFVIFLASFK